MTSPTLYEKIEAALEECANDLEAEIENRYAGTQHGYLSEKRRYERDMEPVKRAREALAALRSAKDEPSEYEPTDAEVEAAYRSYDGDMRSSFRAALIAAARVRGGSHV